VNTSKAVVLICLVLYAAFFMTVFGSVFDKYGDDSIQLIFVTIVIGPVIPVLVLSHKGIIDWINKTN